MSASMRGASKDGIFATATGAVEIVVAAGAAAAGCSAGREHEDTRSRKISTEVRVMRHLGPAKAGHYMDHARAKTIPKPCTRGFTPSIRTPFISPCGVDDTTGAPISFSSGTMTSSVRSAPQDSTSASALRDAA